MDLTNQRFGKLVAIKKTGEYYITPSTGKKQDIYECVCDCGNVTYVAAYCLKYGNTKSCGCLQRERSKQAHTTHNGRFDRLHNVWANMKNRCNNPNYSEYSNYGGRGIKVCEEWNDYASFRDWAINNGYDENAPRSEKTLDRIDVDKNYCPENCRFVDMFVQANNKTNNIYTVYNNQKMTLSELSKITGINYDPLYYRIVTCKMDAESAINKIRQ